MNLASKAEFAGIMGWSRAYVSQLAGEGRLVLVDGLVDVEASRARVEATAADRIRAWPPATSRNAPPAAPAGPLARFQGRAKG